MHSCIYQKYMHQVWTTVKHNLCTVVSLIFSDGRLNNMKLTFPHGPWGLPYLQWMTSQYFRITMRCSYQLFIYTYYVLCTLTILHHYYSNTSLLQTFRGQGNDFEIHMYQEVWDREVTFEKKIINLTRTRKSTSYRFVDALCKQINEVIF